MRSGELLSVNKYLKLSGNKFELSGGNIVNNCTSGDGIGFLLNLILLISNPLVVLI